MFVLASCFSRSLEAAGAGIEGLLGAAGGRGRLRVAQFHTKFGELLPVALLDAVELGNLVLLQVMQRLDGIVPVTDERRRAARQ